MIDALAAPPEITVQGGTPAAGFANITYWLAIVALMAVLVWGFRMLSKELQRPVDSSKGVNGPTMLHEALSEKIADTAGAKDGSFSRVAGAIGAVGIAATFVGISFWILHTLFFDAANLTKIAGLGSYFLAGSAMFLPYAFNQVASIFKS